MPVADSIPVRRLLVALSTALLLAACGEPGTDALLASARDHLAAGDPAAMAIEAKRVLRQNPDQAEARYLLGLALMRSGEAAPGQTELEKALSLGHPPEVVDPVLAQSLLAQRQYQRLISLYGQATLAPPAAQASLQTSLATAYFLVGETDNSEAALAQALALDPNLTAAHMLRARSHAARGQAAAAITGLDTLLSREPGNVDALKLKAELLWLAEGRPEEALAAYRKAAEAKPGDVVAQTEILALQLQLGRLDEAAAQSAALMKLAPAYPRGRYLAAVFAHERRELAQARSLLTALLTQFPSDVQYLMLAGEVELGLGDPAAAETRLSMAVQMAPQSARARRLLASAYLRLNDADKALTALAPMLAAAQPEAAVLALAGDAQRRKGKLALADALLARAAKLDPTNASTQTTATLARLASGGAGDAALAELRRIAASAADVEADLALIGTLVVRQEYDRALQAIDMLEKKRPDGPQTSNLRARVLLARADLAGARRGFERALQISPGWFPAIDGLAAVDMAEGNPQAARQRFEQLLTNNPADVPALLALAQLRAQAGAAKDEVIGLLQRAAAARPNDKSVRLALIDYQLRNGDSAAALAAARDGVAAAPASPELLEALGRSQQATGDLNQAITSYGKLVAMQPRATRPMLLLAGAQLQARDADAAGATLRKALALQPDLLEAQRGLASLALQARDPAAALKIARRVQSQRTKESTGYLLEGEIHAQGKHWLKAVDAYERGLREMPAAVDLAQRTVAALGAAGEAARRDRFSRSWLQAHPRDTAFRLYLGDISAAQRDFAAAEAYYTEVTRINPGDARAFNNLAWVGGRLRRADAIANAEKAVAMAPREPNFMDTLAQLLALDQQYAKALDWQGRALALQPGNPSLRLNLARIHVRAGQNTQARKELDALVALGSKFGGQAEVEKMLKAL